MATPTFKRITLDQFASLLFQFPFTRQVNAVHMHHTWRPSHRDFKGHETIVSMWRYHTQNNGWSDIAQHITIDPEGFIWLGRNWNKPPASAAGHNGNSAFGPFMFEMIGDFDKGRDPFAGSQRDTALRVVSLVQERFNLPASSLRFHNAMSTKSCPGSSMDYGQIVAEVERLRGSGFRGLNRSVAAEEMGEGPFPEEEHFAIHEAIESLSRASQGGNDPADAELSHDEHEATATAEVEFPAAAQARGLSAARLAALQPYVINLSMGRFSDRGAVSTSASDVDAIFEEHLARALIEAKAQTRKLRLLFYAHGGLVSESSGLGVAEKHIDWWIRNDIYPIYFVWETGLFEAIGSMLKRAVFGATRGLADYTSDLLIEAAAPPLRGPQIWGEMKYSAERAVDPQVGGAWYVASKLKVFCDSHPGDIELHAIGHSAGSIFHTHFLQAAHRLGVPRFNTLQLFAPAVRVDTFKQQLLTLLKSGKVAEKLTLFTMRKHFERDDNCAGLYRKSLLYLIFYALEEMRGTPILGLEESLRADPDLKQLFRLDGNNSGPGEVVWSVSAGDTGRSASSATAHGDFDDDPPTMNSALRRILDLADADRIVEYPEKQRSAAPKREWVDEVDWPEEFEQLRETSSSMPAQYLSSLPSQPAFHAAVPLAGGSGGRRMALCVGINEYPDPQHRLAGCVADAQMWARSLARHGFSTNLLLDGQATREAIDRNLRALVGNARPGDVIVFQYSGHGTYVADLNGDEDNDGRDEALCPVDFTSGALYIDDDVAEVFARLSDGVNLTCFMDCCHSGTNSRFAVGSDSGRPLGAKDARRRFVPPTADINRAHVLFRQSLSVSSRAVGSGGPELMRDIKFAACRDDEVAWESDGHGEFTLRATRVLDAGIDGLSHEQFLKKVQADFGPAPRQHPLLDSSERAKSSGLLQPVQGVWPVQGQPQSVANNPLLMQALLQLQQLIGQLSQRGR